MGKKSIKQNTWVDLLIKENKLKFMSSEYYIYIAKCSDDTLYTGYCSSLKEREKTHNEGKGAKYTRNRTPIRIVYSEKFKTKSKAMKREIEIKRLTRKEKQALIKK